MRLIKTEDAVGQVLCHDITQIIKGVTKDARFRKGHIIQEEDIEVLLSLGKDNIYVGELGENMLHEDEAADILRGVCQNEHMHATPSKEGKIELIADIDGLLMVDTERLYRVNSLGEMMIATLISGYPVKQGDKLCGTRIIPLIIEKEKMQRMQELVGSEPLLMLLPFRAKKYGMVVTGNEVFYGRVEDTFSPVIEEKLAEYGCECIARTVLGDDSAAITQEIHKMLDNGAEMIFCTGGMSVDPDDRTPLAIKNTGAEVVSYGSPVLPGAMFMIAYTGDGRPVCGLPGCVMYGKRTIFDLALMRLAADLRIDADWLSGLGNGGLCQNCEQCHFPNCSFGKGV